MPNVKKSLEKLLAQTSKHQPPGSPAEALQKVILQSLHAYDPVQFCRDNLKFEPDGWQARLLQSKSKKIIVNVARQQGKSTTAAAKAVHKAVFSPKSLTLIVAPAIPQAQELRRKIEDHMRELKEITVNTKADNKRELEFSNGSRIMIVAADADTIRGYSPHMIIEDEAAAVPDAVFEALEPSLLVTKGQHILLSTPKGLKGHFADIWHGGGVAWDRYEVTAWHNPRAPRAQLEALKAEKEALGRGWWFAQEYECSFVAAAQGLVYPYAKQKNSSPALPMSERLGWQYVLGIDYGFTDSTAFVVLGWQRDDPNVYVIESFDKRGLLAPEAAEIALRLTKKYPFARMVGDTSGFGKGYVEEARRRFKLPIEAAEKNNKRGYIELFASDLKAGLLKVFPGNEGLLDEWSKLPWDDEREMPMEGYKDHLSDACLYAWRAACHYLEETRKAGPVKGTPEADALEAEAMFEARLAEVVKPKTEWWNEKEDPAWPDLEQMNETSFLN